MKALPTLVLGGWLVTIAGRADAYHEGEERLVDGTAHTLRARETRIGLWDLDFGPVAFATLGTKTAPWLLALFAPAVVPNGFVKLRLLHTRPLTLSAGAAVFHAALPSRASITVVPLSAFASVDLTPRLSLHGGGTYAYAEGDGEIDLVAARIRADAAASTLQFQAKVEWRVTRGIALTIEGRVQPRTTTARFRATLPETLGVNGSFSGEIAPRDRSAAAGLAAIAFSGRHLNVRAGAGYGAVFLPALGLVLPYTTVLPELDVHVRF